MARLERAGSGVPGLDRRPAPEGPTPESEETSAPAIPVEASTPSPRLDLPGPAAPPTLEEALSGIDAAGESPLPEAPPYVHCPAPSHACSFAGPVRRLETSDGATRVVLTAQGCGEPVAIEGATESTATGPLGRPTGERVTEIVVGSPRGHYPPITLAVGQCVVGTVSELGLGYERASETILLRDGNLVFAAAGPMPRSATPFAGWTFRRGTLRRTERMDEDYWVDTYDVRVIHAGVVEEVTEGASILYDTERFVVEVSAYGTRGDLPPYVAWMQRAGYGFLVLRDDRE